jgi:hypothetical protein
MKKEIKMEFFIGYPKNIITFLKIFLDIKAKIVRWVQAKELEFEIRSFFFQIFVLKKKQKSLFQQKVSLRALMFNSNEF